MNKVAVVGCGYWGKNLIRNFHELGVLEAVCDNDEELSKAFAKKYKVTSLPFEEIINSTEIDSIVIAAPAKFHSEIALSGLNAKKHIFVEKPLAMTVDEAKELIIAAKKNKKKLMVGHLLHYHPVFAELKKIIRSGKLGKILVINSNRMSFGKLRSDENVIWSFAPHDISMVLSLTDDIPNGLFASGIDFFRRDIIDSASLSIDFENSLKCNINVSWISPFKEHKLTVITEKGIAVFDDTKKWEEKLIIYNNSFEYQDLPKLNKNEGNYIEIPFGEPLKIECQHFLDIINKDLEPLTNGNEGVNVLSILEAADKSLIKKKYVSIK